jgi:hypothetical protein
VVPALATTCTTVVVRVTPSEPLASGQITWLGIDLATAVGDDGVLVGSVLVDDDLAVLAEDAEDANEEGLLRARIVDLAGNAVEVGLSAAVRVDRQAPVLEVVEQELVANEGAALSVTVRATEPLRAPPVVRLVPVIADAAAPITLEVADLGDDKFSATHVVDAGTADGAWRCCRTGAARGHRDVEPAAWIPRSKRDRVDRGWHGDGRRQPRRSWSQTHDRERAAGPELCPV